MEKSDKEKKSDKNEKLNEVIVLNDVNTYFKLPIYYNPSKIELKQNIINDLELVSTLDASCNPIYNYYFNTIYQENDFSKKLMEQISKYYTTDIQFLKEKQILLQKYNRLEKKYIDYSPNYKGIMDIWTELKSDVDFKEKYYYIDWSFLEFLNKSEYFLQFMSIYNMMSPIISLLVPIIILIIPFIIIKLKGLDLSLSEYIDVLKIVAQTNAIGKLFVVNFGEIDIREKIYIFISAAFYLFSIYQNIMVCVRFNNNMIKIHKYFQEIKQYLNYTIQSMENYLKYSSDLVSQKDFNVIVREKIGTLSEFKNKIENISDYKFGNIKKISEIGKILKYFYELHDDVRYNEAFIYSFGFNGYIDCIEGLSNNIKERKVSFANFIDNNKPDKENNKDKKKEKKKEERKKIEKAKKKNILFKNSYHACLKDDNPVKNTVKLDKNIIITGPNASGKSTILKSTLINIIFSQQFGCGFYDSANFSPFKYIHCYLNIPDTSGRDSLFQAEARRCKNIIDIVDSNEKDTHFCVFDELYSGTNPDEAIVSATAFMKYLIKNKNVSCILTTHFVKVCKNLKNHKNISNCHMITKSEGNRLIYLYKLENGISEVKGGINVLYDMNYPKEIIDYL